MFIEQTTHNEHITLALFSPLDIYFSKFISSQFSVKNGVNFSHNFTSFFSWVWEGRRRKCAH